MQYSFFDSSVPAFTVFWFRIVSMMTADLPVCRSPMTSSRWPRPIGISASIALRPVCIGSCTDLRGMMPGALPPDPAAFDTDRRPLAVDRVAQPIHHAAQQRLVDRHVHDVPGAGHGVAF